MQKTLLTLVFWLGTMATFVCSDEPDKKLHEKCLYPTARVSAHNSSGMGTAFIVRSEKYQDYYRNVAITCAHCVSGNRSFYVRLFKYKNWSVVDSHTDYSAVLFTRNSDRDIAILLFITKEPVPTVELDFDPNLYMGSELFRIGVGLGDDPRLDYGRLTGLRGHIERLKNDWRTSIMSVPGDSGSAVFHKYKVVGITQAFRTFGGGPFGSEHVVFNISYVIPLSELKKWNADLNNTILFVYDAETGLPEIPFTFMRFRSTVNSDSLPRTSWGE